MDMAANQTEMNLNVTLNFSASNRFNIVNGRVETTAKSPILTSREPEKVNNQITTTQKVKSKLNILNTALQDILDRPVETSPQTSIKNALTGTCTIDTLAFSKSTSPTITPRTSTSNLSRSRRTRTRNRNRNSYIPHFNRLTQNALFTIATSKFLAKHRRRRLRIQNFNTLLDNNTHTIHMLFLDGAIKKRSMTQVKTIINYCVENNCCDNFETRKDAIASMVNRTVSQSEPYLCYASRHGWTSLVKYLLSCGARVDAIAPMRHRFTSVLLACVGGHLNVIKELISYGACLTTNDIHLLKSKYHMRVDREYAITQYLTKIWSKRLLRSVQEKNYDAVAMTLALNKNSNICNEIDDLKNNVIHIAVINGSEEILKCLMTHSSKMAGAFNGDYFKPLQLAIVADNLQCAKILIEKGCPRLPFKDFKISILMHKTSNKVTVEYMKSFTRVAFEAVDLTQGSETHVDVVKLIVVHLQEINAANSRSFNLNDLVHLVSEALEETTSSVTVDVEWFGINLKRKDEFPTIKPKKNRRTTKQMTLLDKEKMIASCTKKSGIAKLNNKEETKQESHYYAFRLSNAQKCKLKESQHLIEEHQALFEKHLDKMIISKTFDNHSQWRWMDSSRSRLGTRQNRYKGSTARASMQHLPETIRTSVLI